MRFKRSFKIILYVTLLGLYLSGVVTWILGPDPSAQRIWFLHLHSIISLWFLMVFGYLYHSHVLRGIRAKQKLKSGFAFLIPLGVLIATAPFLFYLVDEKQKDVVALFHTYLGLILILPFFIHFLSRRK